MKFINKSTIVLALSAFAFISCQKEEASYEELTDTKDGVFLSVQKAVNGFQDLQLFPQIAERKDLFSVNYGGLGLPSSDIQVVFEEDKAAMDSINLARKNRGEEEYLSFPAGSYAIDKNSATIKSGQLSSEFLTLIYNPEKFDLEKKYLLALKASNSQGYQFKNNGSTIFYIAEVVEKSHSKSEWTATASSIQESGEGEGNGIARALIDGNTSTFWHSMWSPSSPPFPHWIQIDFKNEIYVTQIGLTRRQNNSNGFKTFDIEGSKDGKTWVTLLKDQEMDREELESQIFPIQPQYLKQIKITMKDNFNNQASTHLAEIDVFGY